MRILVTYGSKMGGTESIAETVGDALRELGMDVDVLTPGEVVSVGDYDAVVVGGALYAGRWHRAARRFVKHHRRALRQRPVWLFSSGPLDDSASNGDVPPVPQVRVLMGRIGARGHVTFGGRMPADASGLVASSLARHHAGDWRAPEQIRQWAADLAGQLMART